MWREREELRLLDMACLTLRSRPSWCSLLFCWVLPLLCLSHTCPPDQYPYSCSSCLTLSLLNVSFPDARMLCAEENAQLLTITDQVQLDTLQLYLEGLGYSGQGFWLGYYFSGADVVVGEEGGSAPSVVVEGLRQSSVGAGGGVGDCVAVRGGRLVPVDCMRKMAHVCLFTYRAPYATYTSPQTVHPTPTNTVSLKANIVGLAITGMEWRQNQMELRPSDTMETWINTDLSQARLTIHSFTPEQHEGFYELLVTNPAGVAMVATWTIRQAELGLFTVSPEDLTIPVGSIAFFECAVSNAMPTPAFSWYHGTEMLSDDGVKTYISNVTHTLLIRNVTAADEGGYQCVVENTAGRMYSRMAGLTVSPQDQFTGVSRRFLLQPQNLSVLEGEPYAVECVGLHTTSRVQYLLNIESAWSPYSYPSSQGFPVLNISRVSVDDDSVLSACLYGRMLGTDFSSTPPAVLTVHTRPRIDFVMTNVGNGTDPLSIPPGSTLEMECKYRGVPSPFQTWYVNGEELAADDEALSSNGSGLAVREVTDPPSGVYQCYVSSQHGTDISSSVLCAEALPGPTPFFVQSDTTSSVYVTWDTPHPPNTHPLLLQYKVVTTHTPTNLTITSGTLPTHLHSYIVTDLNETINYEVTVVAISPLGSGREGVPQRVFTFGKAPTNPPSEFLNINVSRTHENSGLVVQWALTLPPSPGTIFTHYQVEYREVGGGEGEMVMVAANQSWAFVEGLKDASNYEVRLRVKVQVQREPLAYDHSPWSSWLEVQGVTTPPPVSPTNGTGTPTQGPAGDKPLDRDSLLLVVVLVPLLTVIAVVVLLVVVMVGGWRYWSNRPTASYNPSKHEREQDKKAKKKIKGRQVPMGKDVFTLPMEGLSDEEDPNGVGSTHPTVGSSRPSSHSGDTTIDTPVHTPCSNAE